LHEIGRQVPSRICKPSIRNSVSKYGLQVQICMLHWK